MTHPKTRSTTRCAGRGPTRTFEIVQEQPPPLADDNDDGDVEDEFEIIRDNIDFIEGIEEGDGIEPMDDDEEELRNAAERSMRCRLIEEEIRQTPSKALRISRTSYDLEKKLCSRNFERGMIKRGEDERTTRSVYCGRIGYYYSDSCVVFQNSVDRRRILREENRCDKCLDINSTRHECRWTYSSCYYCKT
ncbi:unnamed protein product [Heligmosomoides polygyrus]|uniref:IBR domain-containing protein n=1 Tax=Heligmosomoides polygyrus TaxID=6339 RepID=A0A183G8Q5_HELPZ|nr:unnamed protein product [Heligmosomoides polygyrus]